MAWRDYFKYFKKNGLLKTIRTVILSQIPSNILNNVTFAHCGIGVVINSNSKFGKNVIIGQNVTIGSRYVESINDDLFRKCPTIGNNVRIAVGSTVLGDIIIGDNAIIGAHSLVLEDVPENAIVYGVPAKVVRYRKDITEK